MYFVLAHFMALLVQNFNHNLNHVGVHCGVFFLSFFCYRLIVGQNKRWKMVVKVCFFSFSPIVDIPFLLFAIHEWKTKSKLNEKKGKKTINKFPTVHTQTYTQS
jgi:hypothetical protein